MTQTLTLTMAQLNPIVGDIAGNLEKIRACRAAHADSDLIAFTELIICGYPPEDLILKPAFIARCCDAIETLARETKTGPALLISAPWAENGKCYSSALLLAEGKIQETRHKYELPNYGVFDESRVFAHGPLPLPIRFKGFELGVMICEDMWLPAVSEHLKGNGAEILVTLNGSPFEMDKTHIRTEHAINRTKETGLPLIYLNQIGGQDELVFDGSSFALDARGETVLRMPAFEEKVVTLTLKKQGETVSIRDCPMLAGELTRMESIYQALMLGLRDYVDKNGFGGVLLGMSGGIDSALSAAIAADALGPERVKCVMMPSPYTSKISLEDAKACSESLGTTYETISIEPAMQAFHSMISPALGNDTAGITSENIQARSRGLSLMALSNATSYMVLSTGNKSEMSVGYATLYGDMCGGYNVLKDVYKMMVYELSRWRNANHPKNAKAPAGEVIPMRIITRLPTAELKPNQTDQDSLPPYTELDDILECLIEGEMRLRDIVKRGHTAETVNQIWHLLDRAEYKRRQASPGVKITARAFGRDRRYPITNKFRSLVETED